MSSARALCDEFVRLHHHLPLWKEECQAYRDMIGVSMELRSQSGPFNEASIEQTCSQYLGYWKHLMSMPLQQELKTALGMSMNQPYYLVTINYPPNFANWQFMNEVVKTIASFKNVVSVKHVHEYHGEGENHPHTHMLMRVTKKQKPSELIKAVYAAKGLNKHIGGPNFIDVTKKPKSYEEYEQYINGDKQVGKLGNVALDRIWRAERGLE